MKRPSTAQEYAELVKTLMFEVEDLRSAVEYDGGETMGDALQFLDNLENSVRAVYNSMKAGEYQFADEDLPFMAIVKDASDSMLPFKSLLTLVNETHRNGLDISGS